MSYETKKQLLSAALATRDVRFFTAEELLFTGASNAEVGSRSFGLNCLCPDSLIGNLADAAVNADRFRREFGKALRVISTYRSPAYNRSIAGAADHSLHMEGKAIDLVPVMASVDSMHAMAEKLWAGGKITGGMGIYSWGIHLDIGRKRRW